MTSCSLTYQHYQQILADALRAGFKFRTFRDGADVPQNERVFFMRHDIDLDPFAALRMAQLEHAAGVTATYFILPTSPYYNIMSAPVRDALRSIAALGGDIQLHFDAAPYANAGLDEIENAIAQQARWLEEALGSITVRAVSFHRPASALMGVTLGKYLSAYSPRFFSEFHYISDSAGQFREHCVCALFDKHEVIHCLIHPIWWNDVPRSVDQTLRHFFNAQTNRYDGWLAAEIRSYAAFKQQQPALEELVLGSSHD
jgi:hypothetical protein